MDQLFSLSAQIQQHIIRAGMPAELETAILGAYAELEKKEGRGVKVSFAAAPLAKIPGETPLPDNTAPN